MSSPERSIEIESYALAQNPNGLSLLVDDLYKSLWGIISARQQLAKARIGFRCLQEFFDAGGAVVIEPADYIPDLRVYTPGKDNKVERRASFIGRKLTCDEDEISVRLYDTRTISDTSEWIELQDPGIGIGSFGNSHNYIIAKVYESETEAQ